MGLKLQNIFNTNMRRTISNKAVWEMQKRFKGRWNFQIFNFQIQIFLSLNVTSHKNQKMLDIK